MQIRRYQYPLIAVLGLFLLAACDGDSATPTSLPGTTAPDAEVGQNIGQLAPAIVEALAPSVVHIQTEAVQLDMFNRPVPTGGVGTGSIIDKEGHILTNNHVIDGAQRILVTLSDGRGFEAELVGGDAALDIAVLRIDADDLVPIPIGESSKLRVGDAVIVIGHALDLAGGPTITGGWVSALDRTLQISPSRTMQHLIQTDAAINPGNSGGALVNMDAEFVGIPTAKIPSGEGIGFAIAIDPIQSLIDELIEKGEIGRGFLGASFVNNSAALAMNFNLPTSTGVLVISVAPDSPIKQAGLQHGDIIVTAEDRPIDNTAELDGILIRYPTGGMIEIEYLRDESRFTVTITLAERPT